MTGIISLYISLMEKWHAATNKKGDWLLEVLHWFIFYLLWLMTIVVYSFSMCLNSFFNFRILGEIITAQYGCEGFD